MSSDSGWFSGLDPADVPAHIRAIREQSSSTPVDWPYEAIEAGFADTLDDYYDRLRRATIAAARAASQETTSAPDRQLIQAIRTLETIQESANQLQTRVCEWADAQFSPAYPTEHDWEGPEDRVRSIAATYPEEAGESPLISIAQTTLQLHARHEELCEWIRMLGPSVAPNLTAIAGPLLAGRLLAAAGDLESLAKMPSGTVQVLGAESALFAHLRGQAPSPKHGLIYNHPYIQETASEHRGSAARALAGKLAIAARIDHYSGDRRPELVAELESRIETIQNREANS